MSEWEEWMEDFDGRTTEAGHASIEIHLVTPERWGDLERLFGPRGACAGCWCMYFRLPAAQWERERGDGNRQALQALVESESAPGLLAYMGTEPVGWVAVAPREEFVRLARSRILKPVDDQPVWSVTCFYVARAHRRAGLTVQLLKGAVAHAAERGARIIEGYPVEPPSGNMPPVYAYTGLASAFRAAGFVEVARRSPTRPIMRHVLAT